MFDIDYTSIITTAITLIGGGWLFNIYSAKPRKNSIELENMSKAMGELKGVIDTMKESSSNYREETNKTMSSLKLEIDELRQALVERDKVIYSAYDCPLPVKKSECIVIRTFRECQKCANLKQEEEEE